jgi:hypothetical protein
MPVFTVISTFDPLDTVPPEAATIPAIVVVSTLPVTDEAAIASCAA